MNNNVKNYFIMLFGIICFLTIFIFTSKTFAIQITDIGENGIPISVDDYTCTNNRVMLGFRISNGLIIPTCGLVTEDNGETFSGVTSWSKFEYVNGAATCDSSTFQVGFRKDILPCSGPRCVGEKIGKLKCQTLKTPSGSVLSWTKDKGYYPPIIPRQCYCEAINTCNQCPSGGYNTPPELLIGQTNSNVLAYVNAIYTPGASNPPPCTINSWSPSWDQSVHCNTESQTQTSNCGSTRVVNGTKECLFCNQSCAIHKDGYDPCSYTGLSCMLSSSGGYAGNQYACRNSGCFGKSNCICSLSSHDADIKANESDGPITIDYNSQPTLTWTSSGEASDTCVLSDVNGKTLSTNCVGTIKLENLTSNNTYTITRTYTLQNPLCLLLPFLCSSFSFPPFQFTVSDSVIVQVSPQPSFPPPITRQMSGVFISQNVIFANSNNKIEFNSEQNVINNPPPGFNDIFAPVWKELVP